MKTDMKTKDKGQAIIILLLIMLVALSIGLAVTQRSLSGLSSSNNTEDATRAFSAAEAGIEQAESSGLSQTSVSFINNQSSANVNIVSGLPRANQALEYPPIGKDSEAQFWLADPNTLTPVYPSGGTVNVYFGNPTPVTADTPALEVDLVTIHSGAYVSTRAFYDPNTARNNGFTQPPSATACPAAYGTSGYPSPINTTNSVNTTITDRSFLCYVPIVVPAGDTPIMIRARILYSNTSQPLAVAPSLPVGSSLPPQATIYTSVGKSGQTQKTIQVFKLNSVVPPYFDFSIFSAGPINK